MTDRAQPGAIDSIVRNYELGDALGQFSDGWVVPAAEPTASAQRSDLDETAFTAFDETSSTSSLTVTIEPGEAFVNGWLATDSSTDVELAASTSGQTVGVSWDPDAAFDPNSDADQDDADRVVVALESDVSALDPFLPLWTFETDGSGVTAVVDERQIGPVVGPTALIDSTGNVIENLVGENLTLADGELQGSVGIDVRRAVNDLFIQSARQDFELGLNMLDYRDGQYEVFATDDRIRATNAVDLQLGSPLDDLGYVELGEEPSLSGDDFEEQAEFTGHTTRIRSVFVTDSHGYSASDDDTVKQWDPETMDGTGNEFTGHTDTVRAVFVTDEHGYSASFDDTVKQWDPETMEATGNEFTGHTDNVGSVFVTDTHGYSGDFDSTVKQWDPDTMEPTGNEFAGHTDGARIFSIFVTGSYGYSGAFDDDIVRQWDPDTMEATGNEFTGHTDHVWSLTVTDSHGYSAGGNDTIKQWDPETMDGTGNEFTGHTDTIYVLFVTDTHGYSASRDETVKQWDLETMDGTGNEFTGHTDTVWSVFVTDSLGYSSSDDGTVKQWTGEAPALSGDVSHTFEDLDFVPDEAVINDDLREPLADEATVYYEIEDGDGNKQTIQRSEVDTTVDLTGFTSSEVSTTAIIEREDDTVESPELDAWALYLRDD